MARTKGAKDRKKRKIPSGKRPLNTSVQILPGTSPSDAQIQAPKPVSPVDRPAIPVSDFKAAIVAELGKANPEQPGRVAGPDSPPANPPTAPAGFDPKDLTMEGLTNAWQAPFFGLAVLLGFLGIAPDPEPILAVGQKRAAELAKASYPLWDYFSRKFLNVHPDQQVNMSIGVTVLDGVGIIPDMVRAVQKSRDNAAKAAARTAPPQPTVPTSSS